MSSISILESPTSRRMLDQMHAEQDRRAAAVQALTESFLHAAKDCQDDKLCLFAPRVKTWERGMPSNRIQTMAEVLMDSLDTKPLMARAMKVLMEAAAGKANQTDAQELIEELAAHWADNNAESIL